MDEQKFVFFVAERRRKVNCSTCYSNFEIKLDQDNAIDCESIFNASHLLAIKLDNFSKKKKIEKFFEITGSMKGSCTQTEYHDMIKSDFFFVIIEIDE